MTKKKVEQHTDSLSHTFTHTHIHTHSHTQVIPPGAIYNKFGCTNLYFLEKESKIL
jgi:hypothetical protein